MTKRSFLLKISCVDRPGIVAAITTTLATIGGNIAESSQFWERTGNRFFMRIRIEFSDRMEQCQLEAALEEVISRFSMMVQIRDADARPKIIVMVSKFDHAMLHLLYQIRVGWLRADIVAIVSNHEHFEDFVESEGVAFRHWPVNRENKNEQEAKLTSLIEDSGAELIVLARYMQILSDDFSSRFFGRVMNIHHSFLPSFKGAKPYHQAFDRGVKLIGATAHYVTPDLDEGPIIEQEAERVSHLMTPEDFIATGRDIESRVLARAVKLHLESRVFIHGNKTIVF